MTTAQMLDARPTARQILDYIRWIEQTLDAGIVRPDQRARLADELLTADRALERAQDREAHTSHEEITEWI